MADTERGVVFTLKTKVDGGYQSAFAEMEKRAEQTQHRFASMFTIPPSIFNQTVAAHKAAQDAIDAVSLNGHAKRAAAASVTATTEESLQKKLADIRVKSMANWRKLEEQQEKEEASAAARRKSAMERLAADGEKEHAKMQTAMERALATDDKAAAQREKDKASAVQEALAKTREAQARLNESMRQGVDGVLALTRATALFGLVGQEDFGKVRDTILSIESAISGVRGGMALMGSLRGAAGVSGAAGVAGSAAGAAGGMSAFAPIVGALVPFTAAVGVATLAMLALKRGADVYESTFRAAQRNAAINRMGGGLSKTQYYPGFGPDSLIGPKAVGAEDPTKATGKAPSLYSQIMDNSSGENIFQRIKGAREAIAKEEETNLKIAQRAGLKNEAKEYSARFAAESQRLAGVEGNRRFGRAANEPFARDEAAAALIARGVAPTRADAQAANESRQRELADTLGGHRAALAREKEEIRNQANIARTGSPDEEANAKDKIMAAAEREREIEKEIVGLTRERYDLAVREKEISIDGLRQRISLEKQAYQGRKSDAQHFSELDPFQQAQAAKLIRRVQSGGQLSLFERRQFQGLGLGGMAETGAQFGRMQEGAGRAAMEGLGIAPTRSGADIARFEREENERALTPQLRQEAAAAGAKIGFEVGGEMKIVVDFQKTLAKQLKDEIDPMVENLAADIRESGTVAIEAAVKMIEEAGKRSFEETRRMIQQAKADMNNQGRVNAGR